MATQILSSKIVMQKDETRTLDVELIGHGFWTLNKAQTVGTFTWNSMMVQSDPNYCDRMYKKFRNLFR